VAELADPRYLVGRLQHSIGWRSAFAVLALGSALGIVAMLPLRSLPEAAQIAQGRR
jgi:predicted MFS family arabinose efflux permease